MKACLFSNILSFTDCDLICNIAINAVHKKWSSLNYNQIIYYDKKFSHAFYTMIISIINIDTTILIRSFSFKLQTLQLILEQQPQELDFDFQFLLSISSDQSMPY
jgi:hypothetical protein